MQDTSQFSGWDSKTFLSHFKETKLDTKMMKNKLQRIYQISSYNQQEYQQDVFDAFCWIKLATQIPLNEFIANQKAQKYFLQEFISIAIRNMIMCRQFTHNILMVLTQRIMVEGLKVFTKYYPELETYPKMVSILKTTFNHEKQFYRMNCSVNNNFMMIPFTKQEMIKRSSFIQRLKPGDRVDVLNLEHHTKRLCWLPGVVKKISNINVYVNIDNQKRLYNCDRKSMKVAPYKTYEHLYDWRFQLKQGDFVDLQTNDGKWEQPKIQAIYEVIATNTEQIEVTIRFVKLGIQKPDEQNQYSITDSRIQKYQSMIICQNFANTSYDHYQFYIDDFNDMLIDPDATHFAMHRPDYVRFELFSELLEFSYKQLDLFNRIKDSVQKKAFNIEVISELINFISNVHPFIHRKHAFVYLNQLINLLLIYLTTLDEQAIRNFSKERYELISKSLIEFLKRLKNEKQKDNILEKFEMQLVQKFLFSDFLDKKLQAVTILAQLLKKKMMFQSFIDWIREKKIIPTIYNEKSHSELINRSKQFMELYLQTLPTVQDLSPLLNWNQEIIKLISQNFRDFPEEFQSVVLDKIKSKQKVQNKYALEIVKQTCNCQSWLLKNGGECWVQVVKDKPKKRADIIEAFTMDFPIIFKITNQVSQLYQCRFKNQFFLYANEINYLKTALDLEDIDIQRKLNFAILLLSPLNRISNDSFAALLPLMRQINDSLPLQYQQFFVKLLNKMNKNQINQLYDENFTKVEMLRTIGQGQFSLFQQIFMLRNQYQENIQKNIVHRTSSVHSYRKEKIVIYEVNVNPNQLMGMEQLMLIVFDNKSISVAERALKLIGFLFDHLNQQLVQSAVVFKKNLLTTCLQKLYATEDQQEKYLKIIGKLMNESQKQGCDNEPSVAALYPSQNLQFKLIDHFNVNKKKITLKANSNLTLYEFRGYIGRVLNAHIHEMKILHNGKQLDARLNGHVLHILDLNQQLIIEKKVIIDKVPLTTREGVLNKKVKVILAHIFNQFSTLGYMSKQECQKYHQRCIGEVVSLGQSKVEEIYEIYDTDKDGYLRFQDFLSFYQNAVKSKESSVWSNFQTFGVRNDLEILNDMPIIYPPPEKLTRNLLYKDEKFMNKLFQLLHSQADSVARAAWNFLLRLPIYKGQQKFDLNKKIPFRYWLLTSEDKQEYDNFNRQILTTIFASDRETLCIGLKVAIYSHEFDEEILQQIIKNLIEINNAQALNFEDRIILDYSLRLIHLSLKQNSKLRQKYIKDTENNDYVMSSGLLSQNPQIRSMYCEAIWKLVEESTQDHWILFEIMFKMVYKNFQALDKSTLHIEYFDLFSNFLEKLKENDSHMKKLQLNWQMLASSMIKQYSEHKCVEQSLNSPPDQVAQGFLRIIRRMLSEDNIKELVPFVRYIFTRSLFPETGLHKLKNSQSRKDAYNLIYEICRLKNQNGVSEGIRELFKTDFKKIYKKMSQNKVSYYNFSYYSFNEARSELGYCGIRNLGCICYMISMIQQFYMTLPFRYLILMADDGQPQKLVKKGNKQVDDNLFHQLQNCFANLELSERQQYNPEQFCFSFKDFEGMPTNVTIQQDAQQFLNIFFDRIENSLKGSAFQHVLQGAFGGKSCSRTVCSNCKAVKQREQNFYPLSLEVKGHPNIYHSLNKYIQGQVISDYQCDFCNKKTDVTKSCYISKAPDNFIIHLQRICFNYDRFQNQKINSRLQFPHQLDIYDYSLAKQNNQAIQPEEYQFKLKGVVVHYGSADFGHYFSYIKVSQNQWIEFNDERVRQFDPRDIELECFGGQHWRREHQNAYLLVYERVKQKPIKLQFSDMEEKQTILNKFKLLEVKNELKSSELEFEKKIEEKEIEKEKEVQKNMNSQHKQKMEQIKTQKPRIITYVQSKKIKSYVPEKLATKINQANEQFSFTLNLNNDEFAYFLYQILSIDPPEQLKIQYLELCYQCFQLKQIIIQENNIPLSEWAAKRFKQIITGHGWEFMKKFGQHWQRDIISIEKPTRAGMKTVLECAISDIIEEEVLEKQKQSQGKEEKQKKKMIIDFLEKFLAMMKGDVAKHYFRWKQYFQIWLKLIEKSELVKEFLSEKQVVETICSVVLEDHDSFSHRFMRYFICQFSSAEYEYPLSMLATLIKIGYKLNEKQQRALSYYAFLKKIISYPISTFNLIQYICKDNQAISQKVAYVILQDLPKVNHSDYIKPIIATIHQFLNIQDHIQKKRIQWIMGFPQYIENPRSGSYGVYKINPEQDHIVQFITPVSLVPILQHTIRFKSKYIHIAALLVSMLLQLQSDGLIHNLDEYPSVYAYYLGYTHWFEDFANNYYEQYAEYYHMTKCYEEYAKRLKYLWINRPNRIINSQFKYLIGRVIEQKVVVQTIIAEILEVTEYDIQTALVPIDEKTPTLTKNIIKKLPNNQNFIAKSQTHSLHVGQMSRMKNSSEQEQVATQMPNPFQKAFTATVFRKYIIKNNSQDSWQIVFGVAKNQQPGLIEPNVYLPISQFSVDIRPESYCSFALLKKDLDKQFGVIELKIQILGKSQKLGYWPSQIITALPETPKAEQDAESEDEDSIDY